MGGVPDAESDGGYGSCGSLCRTAKSLDDDTLALPGGGIDGLDPLFEGMMGQGAAKDKAVEVGKTFRIVVVPGKRCPGVGFGLIKLLGSEGG